MTRHGQHGGGAPMGKTRAGVGAGQGQRRQSCCCKAWGAWEGRGPGTDSRAAPRGRAVGRNHSPFSVPGHEEHSG